MNIFEFERRNQGLKELKKYMTGFFSLCLEVNNIEYIDHLGNYRDYCCELLTFVRCLKGKLEKNNLCIFMTGFMLEGHEGSKEWELREKYIKLYNYINNWMNFECKKILNSEDDDCNKANETITEGFKKSYELRYCIGEMVKEFKREFLNYCVKKEGEFCHALK